MVGFEFMLENHYDELTSELQVHSIDSGNYYLEAHDFEYNINNYGNYNIKLNEYLCCKNYKFSNRKKSQVILCHLAIGNNDYYWAHAKLNTQ
jgi:hypothetical protein